MENKFLKIIMNMIGSGLGNNGGSLTCVKSANTLVELGHDVIMIDGGKNKHTWTKLNFPHIVVKDLSKVPNADVIISTAFKTIPSTLLFDISKGKKFHWIRGWELWALPEEKLVNLLKNDIFKIVNSICLYNKLKKFNIESTIIRPGYDFNEIYPLNIRQKNKKVIIGGLYNEGSKRNSKRTDWIFKTFEYLKIKYDIELWMFGTDGTPKLSILSNFYKNPDPKTKNEFYNKCDIWLSPSELEGLHIAPAEAMLTRCPVIGTNAEMSGTQDYLINKETGLISNNNLKDFIKCTEKLINDCELRTKLGNNGRNKVLSLGDRKENMSKLISLLSMKA